MKKRMTLLAIFIGVATTVVLANNSPETTETQDATEFVLPIANEHSSVWNEKKIRKGLTRKAMADLYFVKDVFADEEDTQGEFTDYVEIEEEKPVSYIIFSGTGTKAESSRRFAQIVGKSTNDFRGKKVLGEEKVLVQVVQSQPEAVSFGSASLVFSGANGTVAEGIKVIPFDIDGDGRVSEAERQCVTSLEAFTSFVTHSNRLLARK